MEQQLLSSVSEKSVTFNVDKVELNKEPPRLQTAEELFTMLQISTSKFEDL